MTDFKKCVKTQVRSIVPDCSIIEARGSVSDSSYGIEFYVTVGNKRLQCFDMVDNGIIKENELDNVLNTIAQCYRTQDCYQKGKSNRFSITIE